MSRLTINEKSTKKILDIGCGKKKYSGSIGIDINLKSDADIVYNIEKGLPFKANSFDFVYSNHTLEHIDPKKLVFVLEEIWRVAKPEAKIQIIVPHFSGVGAATNPTHLRAGFTSQTFNYFKSQNEYEKYGKVDFEIKKVVLKKIRTKNPFLNLLWSFVEILANANVLFCEIFWIYWFGGFDEIQFDLQPIKKKA